MKMHVSPRRARTGRIGFRRGNAVLEMALVLPILLMLAFGIADYGQFFYWKNCVQQTAQAAARMAVSASATNSGVANLVSTMMSNASLSGSGYTLTTNPSDISRAATGAPITVTVSVSWGSVGLQTLATGYGGISTSQKITGTAVMYKEPT